jgi:hypothetical protein
VSLLTREPGKYALSTNQLRWLPLMWAHSISRRPRFVFTVLRTVTKILDIRHSSQHWQWGAIRRKRGRLQKYNLEEVRWKREVAATRYHSVDKSRMYLEPGTEWGTESFAKYRHCRPGFGDSSITQACTGFTAPNVPLACGNLCFLVGFCDPGHRRCGHDISVTVKSGFTREPQF